MGEIVRSSGNNGNLSTYPIFPAITISQGAIVDLPVRLALEPNTVRSSISLNSPIIATTEFVFENHAESEALPDIDYSQPFSLRIFQATGLPNIILSLSAYDPSQYTDTTLPMQISGYQSGNYSDPVGGQGIQVEVAEIGVSGQRAIVLAWYTYDASGTSYWLFNSTTVNVGDRSASLPLGYYVGGGFAGGAGQVSAAEWGDVSVSFPDCNHMDYRYQSRAGLPNGVPTGSGSKVLTRVTSINGVTCDSP